GNSGAHSFGQWGRVRGEGVAAMAGEVGHRDVVHHAGKPVGERLLRELQREAAGRVPERGDFLFAEGGSDRDRKMAGAVQHEATARGARLQAACPRGLQLYGAKTKFAANGCDVTSLSEPGTKSRLGQERKESRHLAHGRRNGQAHDDREKPRIGLYAVHGTLKNCLILPREPLEPSGERLCFFFSSVTLEQSGENQNNYR